MPLSASMALGTYEARAELGLTLDVDAFNSVSRSWLNPASPLPTGTLMYSPRRLTPVELENSGKRSASGVLYITVEPFNGDDRRPAPRLAGPSCIEADLGAISPGRAAAGGGHGWLAGGERAF